MKNLDEKLEKLRKKDQVIATEEVQPKLSFVNPVELVDLPSKGKFYPEGHPLKDKETIEIRQMTAKEEDILTNKSYIKKGLIIDKLIESIVVDKNINPLDLLVGDKNAIMVAARIAAYGSSYSVSLNCEECNEKNFVQIDLNEIKTREAPQIITEAIGNSFVNSERLENGSILVQLPKTGWYVECKLMDGKDERKILNLLEVKRKTDLAAELTVSEQLKMIIASINAVRDTNILHEAIDNMPAFDAKHLRRVYQTMIPNVKIEQKFSCSSCLAEQEVEVPFTQEFFWPK